MGVYPVLDLIRFHESDILEVIFNEKYISDSNVKKIKSFCGLKDIPYIIDSHLVSKLAFKKNTYVIGVFKKYEMSLVDNLPHVLLDQPRNMGNIGTIIRTMLGFGVKNLALVRPAADVFDPKVVSSTVGAFFDVNIEYFNAFSDYSERFPVANAVGTSTELREYYPFMLGASKVLGDVDFVSVPTLIMGNENKGLANEYKEVGVPVFIPHNKEIDSLNLSVATSLALWEFSKQK